MTDAVVRRWKQRFPCLGSMRNKVAFSQKVIVATGVLHNLAVMWKDKLPEDAVVMPDKEGEEEKVEEEEDEEEVRLLLERTSEAATREGGEALRDRLRAAMAAAVEEDP